MGRALLGGSGAENAELLARVWHGFYTEELYTEELYREDFTHRVFYTENRLSRKGFTHTHTQKLLHREVFIQSSLDTDKLMTSRDLHSLENWKNENN